MWIRIRDISSFYERLLQGVVLVDEVTAVVRPGMPQVGISGRARAATDLWNGLRQRVDVIVSPQLPPSSVIGVEYMIAVLEVYPLRQI